MNESFENILVEQNGRNLWITLNRPKMRNALSSEMVAELRQVLTPLPNDPSVQTVILRGAGGVFCAGGDLKAFQRIFQGQATQAEIEADNRDFGTFLQQINQLPQTVVMLIEGAAIGGGMGLVCVSDVAIATADARFALSETSLGLPPAQIAAFVVERIGFTQARRLMLTAARFSGEEAQRLGLVHFVEPDAAALEAQAEKTLQQIARCGPQASAATKAILHSHVTEKRPLADTLDLAATHFAKRILSAEGREGVAAFFEKRAPNWPEGD